MLPSIWLQQAEVAAQEKEREIADAQRRIAEQECRVDWQLSQLIPRQEQRNVYLKWILNFHLYYLIMI